MNVQGMAQAYQTQAASMPENNVKSQKKEDAAPERRLKQDTIVISDEARNRIKEKPASKMTAEEKLRQADEFYAKHDELYAQQMASVMKTIGDGMEVAQEIFRRMSSGAKVSKEDEENLMQYDPQMYMAAKNAQMMAEQHEDMSDESLIRKFTEDHAGDRKDWTSELDNQIAQMQQNADAVSET